MRPFVLVLAATLCLVAACDDPVPRTVDETYDQSCDVDEDCEVVSYANCGPCGSCGDLAINIDERSRFDADNQISCFDPFPQVVACGLCARVHGVCIDGACEAAFCDGGEDAGPCVE